MRIIFLFTGMVLINASTLVVDASANDHQSPPPTIPIELVQLDLTGSIPSTILADPKVPPPTRCRVGGLLPYRETGIHTTDACTEELYAFACDQAADNHNSRCESWCANFVKRRDISQDSEFDPPGDIAPSAICTGASNPVARPFAPRFCHKQRRRFIDIRCTVIGPCVCDP